MGAQGADTAREVMNNLVRRLLGNVQSEVVQDRCHDCAGQVSGLRDLWTRNRGCSDTRFPCIIPSPSRIGHDALVDRAA